MRHIENIFVTLRTITIWLELTAAAMLMVGCHAAEAPQSDLVEPVAIEQATSVETAITVDNEPTSTGDSDALAPTNAVVETSFTPPFPGRLEPFEPPQSSQGTVRRNEEHGESVELKGFIHVDQQRVVLSIDGVVAPVPQGGEKHGVQVISIQPPSVVLQRGRARWTATLE